MSALPFDAAIIAPCRMNCGFCSAHLRPKKRCPGCNAGGGDLPKYCAACRLRLCAERTSSFCVDCAGFPCARLRRLDKRYRTRYGMSEIENLECIRDHGIERFLETERGRWVADGSVLCVHDRRRYPLPGRESHP